MRRELESLSQIIGNSQLRRLDISHCCIGRSEVEHMLDSSLTSSLEYLDIRGNPIDTGGAQVLVDSLLGVRSVRADVREVVQEPQESVGSKM